MANKRPIYLILDWIDSKGTEPMREGGRVIRKLFNVGRSNARIKKRIKCGMRNTVVQSI